jgi:hypothetical protein
VADPTHIVPPVGINPFRRTAITPVRRVHVLTQTIGVPSLDDGGGRIAGVASVAGAPTAGAIVSLLTDPGNLLVKQTVSGVGGTYAFSGLPAGRYQVLVYDPSQSYRSKVIHVDVPDPDIFVTEGGDILLTEAGDRLLVEG